MIRKFLTFGAGALLILLAGFTLFWWIADPLGEHTDPPNTPLPQIATDLPRTWPEANDLFTQRVKQAFPKSLKFSALRAQLIEMGFALRGDTYASYRRSSFPCGEDWSIHWTLNGDMAEVSLGTYWLSCL